MWTQKWYARFNGKFHPPTSKLILAPISTYTMATTYYYKSASLLFHQTNEIKIMWDDLQDFEAFPINSLCMGTTWRSELRVVIDGNMNCHAHVITIVSSAGMVTSLIAECDITGLAVWCRVSWPSTSPVLRRRLEDGVFVIADWRRRRRRCCVQQHHFVIPWIALKYTCHISW